MEVLDTTIANVALRHIGGSLAADQDESTWILTSYLVSNRSSCDQRLAGQCHGPQAVLHDLRGAVHREFAAVRHVDVAEHDAGARVPAGLAAGHGADRAVDVRDYVFRRRNVLRRSRCMV